jgi:hypothetical protein
MGGFELELVQAIHEHVWACVNCRVYLQMTNNAMKYYNDLASGPGHMAIITECVSRTPVVSSLLGRGLCSFGDVLAVVCLYAKCVISKGLEN